MKGYGIYIENVQGMWKKIMLKKLKGCEQKSWDDWKTSKDAGKGSKDAGKGLMDAGKRSRDTGRNQ